MTSDHQKDKQTIKEYKLKNYNIRKTIGKGTFGKVRIGVHIPTGEKVLSKNYLGGYKNFRKIKDDRIC